MNRKKGLALMASGVILAVVTLLGVFAVANDTADTGTLSVETATRGTALDLQISTNSFAPPTTIFDAVQCDQVTLWSEDQASTDILAINNASPGTQQVRIVCLRNTGTETLHLDTSIFATASTETGCSGDEPDVDPDGPTCGAAGELADDVDLDVRADTTTASEPQTCFLGESVSSYASFDGIADSISPTDTTLSLDPGARLCVRLRMTYDASTPTAESVENQTDKVAFQVRFHGDLS